MIKINSWYGGIGNNIIQLKNVLNIALYYRFKISLPDNKFFDTEFIRNINNEYEEFYKNKNILLTDDKINFFNKHMINIDKKCFDYNNENVIKILKKVFKINVDDVNIIDNVNIIDVNTFININNINVNNMITSKKTTNNCLIHIRSGDIFNNCVDSGYTQPPLFYYLLILQRENFDNITLIAEDTINPVINALLKIYPNIKYKKQSLEEDIKEVLSANVIMSGIGSFIPSLLLLSNNIKKLYRPSYAIRNHFNFNYDDVKILYVDLEEYINTMHPWKNTDEQKENMIRFRINFVNNHQQKQQ